MPSCSYCVVLSVFCTVLATSDKYANKFELHVEGGIEVALDLARKYDCRVLSPVGSLQDRYILERNQLEGNGKKKVSYSTRNTKLENEMMTERGVKTMEHQTFTHRVKRALTFNDPFYANMWYVNDANWHLNVSAAWEDGWTGQGIVVAVVDDGLETTHTDLADNYDARASYDYVLYDSDPHPDFSDNWHGTACAGEIAAIANNSNCIVGVAYNSRIGGIRVLDEFMTDADEAAALSHEPQYIDIYSNSWGPSDNGYTWGIPGLSTRIALYEGVTNGRGGKGSIYVWAAGNGGDNQDACGTDGYVNSIETIAITAVTSSGQQAYYGEQCAAIMAATLSSGNASIGDRYISTTGLVNGCVHDFSGTSAATPLASGIIALALQANNDLSWRDVQHIIAETAVSETLEDGEWSVNGAGHSVSHKYGFGLMDAGKMIDLARNWAAVTSQMFQSYSIEPLKIVSGTGIIHEETIDVSRVENSMELTALEHVVLRISIEHDNVNDLEITIMSPMMTNSILLHRRGSTPFAAILTNWPFLSVHYWGEAPNGAWTVTIRNQGLASNTGKVTKIQLILYGTGITTSTGNGNETTPGTGIETTPGTGIETTPGTGIETTPGTVVDPVNTILVISIVIPIFIVVCAIGVIVVIYFVNKKKTRVGP